MTWLNINIPDLRKPAFTSCEPYELGVWLRLSCYCAGQENGGKIRDCRKWTDRQWLIACGVTADDVARQCALWSWSTTCLTIALYPVAKEREVAAKRAAGKATAKARWGRQFVIKNPPEKRVNGSSAHRSVDSSAISSADTEEERNRNGKE